MTRTHDEQGFALVAAIVILTVMMGLGLGLLLFADTQQKASAHEQASESAFNVAEAALNAQVGQVSRAWPGTKGLEIPKPEAVESCTAATSTSTNGCPTTASLTTGYPNTSPAPCSAGTSKDAWGSPLTNQWTTYVRDDAASTETLFNSGIDQKQPHFDNNKDGKVWVRSVGVAQCRVVTLITLVSQQFVAANFPRNVMSANWFKTGNNGKGQEEIVDARGSAENPGDVSMRCSGFVGTEKQILEACANYRVGQIEPAEVVHGPPGSPSPTLSVTQREALRQQAEWAGTYYPAGNCPAGLPAGAIVYVEGPCSINGGGNESVNTKAAPGFLIIANGTFEMIGNSVFWGTVYAVNKQGSTGLVVTLGGSAQLHGMINVDGNGGIEVGENHNKNLEYDPTAAVELKTYAGATPTRNTFRILPINQ